MTWGRGFFRLWLFLSALWIGLCVYLNEPKTYTTFWRAVYEAKHQDGRIAEFDLAKKSPAELSAEVTAWMQAQRPDIDINTIEFQKDRALLLARLSSQHQPQMAKAKDAWLLTVLPPLALLGLGLCIVWIGRGFRPRSKQQTTR